MENLSSCPNWSVESGISYTYYCPLVEKGPLSIESNNSIEMQENLVKENLPK